MYADPAGFQVAVLHNGVIDIAHDRLRTSDTAAFVVQVLAELPSRWWEQPALRYLVSAAIGWSRLIVFPALGEATLLNEGSGEWDGGIWFSSSHRPSGLKAFSSPAGGFSGGASRRTRSRSEGQP
ncbi:MAG: hypothetical protein U0838_07970 [Chloroflexota bacterium]